jgi:uncharacterized surface protein with fasciclin (FAS1) repeats
MKVNNSNWLTKLAGIVGVTGVSFLISLPTQASGATKKEVLNPSPSIFSEAPYSGSERVLTKVQYIPSAASVADKSEKPKRNNLSQQGGSRLNPKPRILDECPYNRAACGSGTPSSPGTRPVTPVPEAPEPTPTQPPSETPDTTPTTPPGTTPTPPPGKPGAGTEGKNLVAIAESNSSFTVLTKALKAAGLTDILQGKGPFTVFAPTDKAFSELPQDAVRDLFKKENKEVLLKILRYHVVDGSVLSTDLKAGEVKSIEGGPISVKIDGRKGVMINDARVIQPDIKGSNGVIHAIDKVILPPDL